MGDRRRYWLRLAACCVFGVAVLSCCSVPDHHAAPETAETNGLCGLLELPIKDLAKHHLTFAKTVSTDGHGDGTGGTPAILAFALGAGPQPVGAYGVVLHHLADVGRAQVAAEAGRNPTFPRPSPQVRANARALDRALEHGLCA